MKLSRLAVVLVSVVLAAPAVIFWLWLVVVPVKVAEECPAECMCVAERHVYCLGVSLHAISLIFLKGIKALFLGFTNMNSLEMDMFSSRGLSELEVLSLEIGSLRTIEVGAFNGITKLTHLTIKGNLIKELQSGTFEKLSNLEYLGLRENRIQKLNFDTFFGLVNIECIDLGHNKLRYIDPNVFSGLTELHTLVLHQNPSLHTPSDSHFFRSPSLKRLVISACNVSSLSVETFANVSTIEWLDLSYNGLTNIDINIFKHFLNLKALFLHNNPLHCNCKLEEVWQWCVDSNITVEHSQYVVECNTPEEVKGKFWGVLKEVECLQDNVYNTGEHRIKKRSYRRTADFDNDFKDYIGHGALSDDEIFLCRTEYDYVPNTDTYKNLTNLLKQIQGPVLAVPFTFGTVGNMILIIIILSNKDMRTVPNMYILNLAISDIIYLTVHFSEAWLNKISDTWLDDDFVCKFLPFCRRLSVGLSAYSVTVLSIIRYRVIVNALHVRVSSRQRYCTTVATLCGVWIVAASFAIPSALSEHLCHAYVISDRITYYQLVVLFETLVSCVLPLYVIGFSYIMTARHLVKSADPISEGTQNPQINKRKSTVKIVLGLTVVFLISSLPYHVFWAYIIYVDTPYRAVASNIRSKIHYFQYMYLVSNSLLLLNPCLNPVALFCTSLAFREKLKRYLKCCSKANST